MIAFKGDLVDHRRFDHGDDQLAAGLVDADILKEAGPIQRFERGIDLGRVETLAWRYFEIGADCIGFDAPIAFDHDRAGSEDGLRPGRRHKRSPPGDDSRQEQAGDNQPPCYPHPHAHPQRALYPSWPPPVAD